MNLPKAIKHLQIDHNMNNQDLALILGVSRSYMSLLLNGKRVFSLPMTLAIAGAFQLKASELVALGESS